MRILDRYILKSVINVFCVCLFTFLFLYVIIDIFSRLEDLLREKLAVEIIAKYYLSYLPVIFNQVAPFAGLLSVLYAFGKLNRENEIIAMRSSGLSIIQLSHTLIIFGFLLSLFMFWSNDKLIPRALVAQQEFIKEVDKGKHKGKEKEREAIYNLYMYGLRNRLYSINKFSPVSNTIEGITILEQDEHQNIVRKIVANKGVYSDNLWTFYQSITYDFDDNGQIKNEPVYLEKQTMAIPETPDDFLTQRRSPDSMTISQLEGYLWKLSKSGATGVIRNLKVDLYQRFASPFMALIMIIIGIPFSFMIKKRAAGMSSLGVSIGVGFLYYVLNAVSIALGKSGVFTPLIAASFSHIVIFSMSLYLILNLR